MMANTNRLSLILGMAMLFSIGINGFEKRCYRDSGDPPGTFTLVLREKFVATTAEQIMALNADNAPSTCKSIKVSSDTINELIIKFDTASTTQIFPSLAAMNCFVMYTDPTFLVKVAVQKDPDYVQVTDSFYAAGCNTSAVDTGYVQLSPVNITNGEPFESPVERNDTVTIQLVDTFGNVVTAPVLGQTVKIRVTYSLHQDVAPGEYPIGLHNFDLTVGPEPGDNGRIQLINDTGCVPLTPNAFGLTRTYTYNATTSDRTKNVFETGQFTIVMFATTTQLHFKGNYQAECYEVTEDKCFNQTAYCESLPGRKRRAVENEVNGTYTLNINVGMPGHPTTGQNVGSDNDSKTQECAADKTFWILSVILGASLLFVTMVTMYVFCRLRTEQKSNDKVTQKSGYANQAF